MEAAHLGSGNRICTVVFADIVQYTEESVSRQVEMKAAFSAILLMALGADISLAGEHRGAVSSIPTADMISAFRYVFGAAAALLACSALCLIVMEERPLAGPPARIEMAE